MELSMYIIFVILFIIVLFFAIDWIIENNFTLEKNIREIIRKFHNERSAIASPKIIAPAGISFLINDDQVVALAISIISLREVGCNLPICIVHCQDELSNESKNLLKKIDQHLFFAQPITTHSIVDAIIATPFDKVFYVKPNVIFIKNPESLFLNNSDTIFWKDSCTTGVLDKIVYNWVKKIIPYRIGDNRILNKESGSYQSSDLILITKSTHSGTLRYLKILMEAESINTKIPEKELFWIACELARENCVFIDYPGAIGELFGGNLCNHVLYANEMGDFMCWTGGVEEFTHYAIHNENVKWSPRGCLYGGEYKELDSNLKNVINRYLYLLHSINELLLF